MDEPIARFICIVVSDTVFQHSFYSVVRALAQVAFLFLLEPLSLSAFLALLLFLMFGIQFGTMMFRKNLSLSVYLHTNEINCLPRQII